MGEKKKNEGVIEKILSDINKFPAASQIVIGTTTGWCTGFLGMKIGKVTAICVGSSIILLQIASHTGYIKINWNKVNNKIEKISDKVEESITGQPPNWMDKMERFVDKKIDEAENLLKKQKKQSFWDTIRGKSSEVKSFNTFMISFLAGLAVGIATG